MRQFVDADHDTVLDDNTYTNKTWAEVSGIAVSEIHVMEVEFLSNMRYNLYASKEEWEEWLQVLARFHEFSERAQRPISPLTLTTPTFSGGVSSPTQRVFGSPLPSPTSRGSLQPPLSLNAGPAGRKRGQLEETVQDVVEPAPKRQAVQRPPQPVAGGSIPQHQIPPLRLTIPTQNAVPTAVTGIVSSVSSAMPVSGSVYTTSMNPQPVISSFDPMAAATAASTMSGRPSQPAQPPQPRPAVPYSAGANPTAMSLPPLSNGVRAMATVYPPTTAASNGMPPALAGSGPSMPTTPSAANPAANMLHGGAHHHTPHHQQGYPTPNRQLSPSHRGQLHPGSASGYASSPLAETFPGSASGLHTPTLGPQLQQHQMLSPSIYYQQRNSPYKPVRNVNTLLYPPPPQLNYGLTHRLSFGSGGGAAGRQQPQGMLPSQSSNHQLASTHAQHVSQHQQHSVSQMVLPPNAGQGQQPGQPGYQHVPQMHYQPLGRRHEFRTGIVPEFLHPVPAMQSHAGTPQMMYAAGSPHHHQPPHQQAAGAVPVQNAMQSAHVPPVAATAQPQAGTGGNGHVRATSGDLRQQMHHQHLQQQQTHVHVQQQPHYQANPYPPANGTGMGHL